LRPSGTDRGLLRRITQVTGGKMRDTLAGIFSDREALRFAYQNLNQLLVLLAAAFLLLGVAARRLAVPDIASRASAALASWLTSSRRRQARARPKAEPSAQQEVLQSLRDKKAHHEALRPEPLPEPLARPAQSPRERAQLSPSTVDAPPPSRPPRFSQPPPSGSASGGTSDAPPRKPTAAEVLLARRRGRRS